MLSNPNIDQTNITASDIVYAYVRSFDSREPIENIALYGPSRADMEELWESIRHVYPSLTTVEAKQELDFVAELLRRACVRKLISRIDELEEASK